MTKLEKLIEKFFLENSYSERDGYYVTTYSFDEDYLCTMDVDQYDEDYDDECEEDKPDEDEYYLLYKVKISCENRFEVVSSVCYLTRHNRYEGFTIESINGEEQLIDWIKSDPKIVRWAGTD